MGSRRSEITVNIKDGLEKAKIKQGSWKRYAARYLTNHLKDYLVALSNEEGGWEGAENLLRDVGEFLNNKEYFDHWLVSVEVNAFRLESRSSDRFLDDKEYQNKIYRGSAVPAHNIDTLFKTLIGMITEALDANPPDFPGKEDV